VSKRQNIMRMASLLPGEEHLRCKKVFIVSEMQRFYFGTGHWKHGHACLVVSCGAAEREITVSGSAKSFLESGEHPIDISQ